MTIDIFYARPNVLILGFVIGAISGCSGGSDSLSVTKATTDGESYVLTLTSKVDDVDVQKVQVNRGNCRVNFEQTHLKFGQQWTLAAFCNPLEAEVTTSAGTVSVSWKD